MMSLRLFEDGDGSIFICHQPLKCGIRSFHVRTGNLHLLLKFLVVESYKQLSLLNLFPLIDQNFTDPCGDLGADGCGNKDPNPGWTVIDKSLADMSALRSATPLLEKSCSEQSDIVFLTTTKTLGQFDYGCSAFWPFISHSILK